MQHIPVFLASNDKFAPFVATTIASICANTYDFIDFYILDSGISKHNRQKICDTKQFFDNFSIKFIKVDCDKKFAHLPKLKHISRDMYSRFLIPEILPDCEKVIYSDIDVAFVGDISELYNEDLDNKVIGAVPCYNSDKIIHNQFCSALLLLNCKKLNEQNFKKHISDTATELLQNKSLRLPDQDILNRLYSHNYLELELKYGIISKYLNSNNKFELNKNWIILHFPGGGLNKPWNNKNIPGAEYFWQYVPFTSFSEEIEEIYQSFTRKKKVKNFFHQFFNIHNRNLAGQTYKVFSMFGIKFKINIQKGK